jgi:phage anti-repressor protein
MSPLNFNLSTALTLLDSSEQFPVDFHQAWEWIGYKHKYEAQSHLLERGFVEEIDFVAIDPIKTQFEKIYEDGQKLGMDNFFIAMTAASQIPQVKPSDESSFGKVIARILGGFVEQDVKTGRVDVLTSDTIWELKRSFVNFGKALEQLKRHQSALPNHKKGFYLVGDANQFVIERAKNACLHHKLEFAYMSNAEFEQIQRDYFNVNVKVLLTIDCFKTLGMVAGTPQGKQIREYFRESK